MCNTGSGTIPHSPLTPSSMGPHSSECLLYLYSHQQHHHQFVSSCSCSDPGDAVGNKQQQQQQQQHRGGQHPGNSTPHSDAMQQQLHSPFGPGGGMKMGGGLGMGMGGPDSGNPIMGPNNGKPGGFGPSDVSLPENVCVSVFVLLLFSFGIILEQIRRCMTIVYFSMEPMRAVFFSVWPSGRLPV